MMRSGGVVVLSGPALRTALECALAAIRASRPAGRSPRAYEALACELRAAMAVDGHSDVRATPISHPVPMQPTVPLDDAAERLNISIRQARRRAPQLGGQKISGRWFVDELALREHIGGTR